MALGKADPETKTITTVVRGVDCGRHPEDQDVLCVRLTVDEGITVDALITWRDAQELYYLLKGELLAAKVEPKPEYRHLRRVLPGHPNPMTEGPSDGE